jgi:hypothetical protein
MASPIFVSTVWLLCMVAALAHGAERVSSFAGVLQFATAFGLTFTAALFLSPQPGWIGFLAALFAFWRLIHRGGAAIDRTLAGVSAALAGALFAGHGLNVWISGAAAAALLGLGLMLARSPKASVERMRAPALAVVAFSAAAVGLAPEVASGWRSAVILNKAVVVTPAVAIPDWAVAIVLAALAAGLARGLWVRR